jgi:hypothetical protein
LAETQKEPWEAEALLEVVIIMTAAESHLCRACAVSLRAKNAAFSCLQPRRFLAITSQIDKRRLASYRNQQVENFLLPLPHSKHAR